MYFLYIESGAVFTLGKSYLSENHQSYFFIRNDPIKKLIAGSSQSAVICGKLKYINEKCSITNERVINKRVPNDNSMIAYHLNKCYNNPIIQAPIRVKSAFYISHPAPVIPFSTLLRSFYRIY